MSVMANVLNNVRRGHGPYRLVRPLWRKILRVRVPVVRPIAALLYAERDLRFYIVPLLLKMFYREPLLRYRCANVGRGLDMHGALPLIYGNGRIEIGEDVCLQGRNTWVVGYKVSRDPALIIGNRVTVGYGVTLSVANRVEIGDDTMIAAGVQIYDNITHPLSPARRLRHESFTFEESTPVIIGRNVWIGSGAIIMRGVTIGDNSIVSAGAIVRQPVPANTLVAGNPAQVVKSIADAVV